MNPFLVLALVVLVALVFDYINGFHDTANAVATVVSTGVLPLRTAILLAALLNFVGALTGTAVAGAIGKGIINPDVVSQVMILSALLGAIIWNLFTWYFGIPTSSSHAVVGGIVGAGVSRAGFAAVQGEGVLRIVKGLIVSPFVGFGLAFVIMIGLMWASKLARPAVLTKVFRRLQMVSSCFMAFSHGSNDAQKTMGIITMSLVAYGAIPKTSAAFPVPLWVVVACAAAMALGTAAGGLRIIKTMGTKIIDLKPIHGVAAETSAALTILGASTIGLPIGTTQVITGAIMGAGASQRVSAVRWGVTVRILWAWVLTIPMTASLAWCSYRITSTFLGP
jgi:PiT family inorganic phosphate transporter